MNHTANDSLLQFARNGHVLTATMTRAPVNALEASETRALYDNPVTRDEVTAFLERRPPQPSKEPTP